MVEVLQKTAKKWTFFLFFEESTQTCHWKGRLKINDTLNKNGEGSNKERVVRAFSEAGVTSCAIMENKINGKETSFYVLDYEGKMEGPWVNQFPQYAKDETTAHKRHVPYRKTSPQNPFLRSEIIFKKKAKEYAEKIIKHYQKQNNAASVRMVDPSHISSPDDIIEEKRIQKADEEVEEARYEVIVAYLNMEEMVFHAKRDFLNQVTTAQEERDTADRAVIALEKEAQDAKDQAKQIEEKAKAAEVQLAEAKEKALAAGRKLRNATLEVNKHIDIV